MEVIKAGDLWIQEDHCFQLFTDCGGMLTLYFNGPIESCLWDTDWIKYKVGDSIDDLLEHGKIAEKWEYLGNVYD